MAKTLRTSDRPEAGAPALPPGLAEQLPRPNHQGLRFSAQSCDLTLPSGVRLRLRAVAKKQQLAHEGDQLIAAARFFVNCPGSHRTIDERVQFGPRIMLAGEALWDSWGQAANDQWRYRDTDVTADTWLAALIAAETEALTQACILWNALVCREACMHSDGEEYFIARTSGLSNDQDAAKTKDDEEMPF